MLTLQQVETAILTLPPKDFEKLRQWLFDLDCQRWDNQIQRNIAKCELEALAQEAIAEFNAGQYQKVELPCIAAEPER
jgi:ABC-type sulfate/molybdate transport systems ATPase subunit